MIAKLQPYLIWIKLALAVAVVAGSAYSGWIVRGWKADADLAAAADARVVALEEAAKDYKTELFEQEKFKDSQRKDFLTKQEVFGKRIAKLEEDLRNANAKLNTITPRDGEVLRPDEPFNLEFVRLWNDPVRAVNALVPSYRESGFVGTPSSTTAARVEREDLLRVHKETLEECNLWGTQLDMFLALDAKQHGKGEQK